MLPLNLYHFQTKDPNDLVVNKISPKIVKIIEKTDRIKIDTKIEILQILLGEKWISEIDFCNENYEQITNFLKSIKIPFYINEYQNYKWLQIGANRAILDYIKENRETLTELEAGILYGYPPSAVLAFSGMLKSSSKKRILTTLITFGGVQSEAFYSSENILCEEKWRKIHNLSPKIAEEARVFYSKLTS